MGKRVYADVADTVILSTESDVLHEWLQFEVDVFDDLQADPHQKYGTLLNVGSGRRITEPEQPFFDRFGQWFLLEPDAGRRAALAEAVAGRNAVLLGDRIEQLDTATIPAADFVLCKYVLQHIETTLVAPAIQVLRSAAAPGGKVGLFLALVDADESTYQLVVPAEAARAVPRRWRRGAHRDETQLSRLIDRADFDELISGNWDFPFIATHHFGRRELAETFPGFAVTGTATGVGFLQLTV